MDNGRMVQLNRRAVRFAGTLRSLVRRYRRHEAVLVGLQLRFAAESLLLYVGSAAAGGSRGARMKSLAGAVRTGCECLDCADAAFDAQLISERDYRTLCVEGYEMISMIRGVHRRMHG